MNDAILLSHLIRIRNEAIAFAEQYSGLAAIDAAHQASVQNLLHYMSVRNTDLRELQLELIKRGLSSLGILEAHTLATLNSVIANLQAIMGLPVDEPPPAPVSVDASQQRLELRGDGLFGSRPEHREGRIMVTMPSEAADQPALLNHLLEAGMDVMRVNCAHDSAAEWQRMLGHLHDGEALTGKTCKVQLDLAGPKLRTGNIGIQGHVLKLRPERDPFGHVLVSARVWLVPEGHEPVDEQTPTLEVSGNILGKTRRGDKAYLTDARGASRHLLVIEEWDDCRLAETRQTIYFQENTSLRFKRAGNKLGSAHLVNLPPLVMPLELHSGDQLILTRQAIAGYCGERDASGRQLSPSHIHCTLPEAFDAVLPGQQVWLDDGKMGGEVESNSGEGICLRITHVPPGGAKLRAEKGINFPDTCFAMPALTAKDIADLEAMAGKVDMVALSFVRSPADIAALQAHLHRLGIPDTGIILKIENRAAFENLPAILLTAMRLPKVGVMIARGDLAVEMGFERLSEVQEEILWLCEAAHIPVIWATQILENMAKKGAPSRAEISDAAMSIRAECTMLNKGANIVETVRFLDGIMQRMASHYHKRRLMMRPLAVCNGDSIAQT
jgi:pyruvate kinase